MNVARSEEKRRMWASMTPEERRLRIERIQAGVRRAAKEREGAMGRPANWAVPEGYKDLFHFLVRRVGIREAKRMVEQQVEVDERRRVKGY